MVMQNGQAVATMLAPVPNISSVRSVFTSLLPGSASLNICAPPAPQHKALLLLRGISVVFAFKESITERGDS